MSGLSRWAKAFTIWLAVVFLCATGGAFAQERVRFDRGQSAQTLRGTIRGYDDIAYIVNARAGQRLAVSIKTSNTSAYFNILRRGASEAIFTGSIAGEFADVIVPAGGDYVVQVYLMRNAARRNERAQFSLRIEVTGRAADENLGPQPDFADGLAGGPDFWAVAGVSSGDPLNIRRTPSAQGQILARLRNGAVLRNRGCRMNGQTRWCRVESRDGKVSGWAAGRYLVEYGG